MSSKKLPTFNDDTDDEEAFDVAKTSSKKAAGTSSKKSIPINVTIPSAPPSDEHAPSSPSQQHHDSHAVEIPPTRVPDWLLDHIEYVFKIRQRKTTVEMELFTGVIQFISCVYVLPVVPDQMKRAGYDEVDSIMATTVTCAIVSMQQSGFTSKEGNAGLLIAGAALAFLGFVPPVGRFFTKLIPDSIQAAISVGIGLITALAGATEINLVVRGKYTILDMGELTTEIVVAIANLIIVAVMLHYHVKGAFCCGLFVGTLLWWIIDNAWPNSFAAQPETKNSAGLTTMLSAYMSGPPVLISPETAAEYRTQPWFTKQKAKPLSQAEDVDKYDMEDVDLDETAHPAPNLDDGKKRNILQRTMLKINEILDAQDIKGDTNITSTPEQGNMY
eukprot:scaffold300_cov173-Ochromonas_danica.AAC.24